MCVLGSTVQNKQDLLTGRILGHKSRMTPRSSRFLNRHRAQGQTPLCVTARGEHSLCNLGKSPPLLHQVLHRAMSELGSGTQGTWSALECLRGEEAAASRVSVIWDSHPSLLKPWQPCFYLFHILGFCLKLSWGKEAITTGLYLCAFKPCKSTILFSCLLKVSSAI